jgi:thioredoxin 1
MRLFLTAALFFSLVSPLFSESGGIKTAPQKLPRLVDLGAKKCVPCKMMAPVLDGLSKDFAGVMDVEFIDVWEKENEKKAEAYKISSIPTQIFLSPDGKELWRHEGFISRDDILEKWKSLGYDINPPKGAPAGGGLK